MFSIEIHFIDKILDWCVCVWVKYHDLIWMVFMVNVWLQCTFCATKLGNKKRCSNQHLLLLIVNKNWILLVLSTFPSSLFSWLPMFDHNLLHLLYKIFEFGKFCDVVSPPLTYWLNLSTSRLSHLLYFSPTPGSLCLTTTCSTFSIRFLNLEKFVLCSMLT